MGAVNEYEVQKLRADRFEREWIRWQALAVKAADTLWAVARKKKPPYDPNDIINEVHDQRRASDRPHTTGEELELRRLLWLHHGHSRLYGDDGEMQCSECPLDFKRDPVERISTVIELRNFAQQYLSKEVVNQVLSDITGQHEP